MSQKIAKALKFHLDSHQANVTFMINYQEVKYSWIKQTEPDGTTVRTAPWVRLIIPIKEETNEYFIKRNQQLL